MAQLEGHATRLSRRVETAELEPEPPANIGEGQQRSRGSQQRRKSSVVEELARQLQQLTDNLAENDAAIEDHRRRSRGFRDKSVAFMLALSYADLISDLVLAVVLLRGAQAAYGVVALVILSVSLVVQVLLVKFLGKKPWLSKDTLLTAVCLGHALEAYRQFAGEPAGPPGAYSATQLLASLKAIEVAVETLPAVVLQLVLLNASSDNWTSPELLISLSISIAAAAMLMVNAESTINGDAGDRRRNNDYYGYLPRKGGRRVVLLASLTFFMAGYLMLAASSIAVAVQLFPMWVVGTVLVADCAIHHATRALEGEWWIIGDHVRSGLGLRLVDTLFNTALWLLAHACPLLFARHVSFVGPHCMARIVVCSLLEGTFVTVAALTLTADDSAFAASHIIAWRVCLPALSVALVSLAAFFAAMDPQYRQSFYVRDTRRAMHRRHWAAWAEGTHGEEDRALIVGDASRYVGEPVVVWIEQRAAQWARSRPAWCTAEWRAEVLEHARLLPGNGAARVAAAMSRVAGSDDSGTRGRVLAGSGPSERARSTAGAPEAAVRDVSYALVV
jgi:hypothetical protein